MKRRMLAAAAVITFLPFGTLHASAASVEDVYQAMQDVGCTAGMITDAKVQYENTEHDNIGMYMGTEYHTFQEWVQLIHRYGITYVVNVIAEFFGIDSQDIIDYYDLQTESDNPSSPPANSETTEPSVTPEKPFDQMTLEEMRAYIDSLPYDERVAFIATLTPEQRRSILKQLPNEQKTEIAAGMVDFGSQLGLSVSIDKINADDLQLSIRNQDGELIDSSSLGFTVDATGWDTTYLFLGSLCMILTACSGIYLLGKGQKEDTNG
ncbi:MAG: hypothetical protein MJ071_05770 [Oscillospiraceae bacterium]|nr:hypothetical protein [Oscillospiraceae bacterium]